MHRFYKKVSFRFLVFLFLPLMFFCGRKEKNAQSFPQTPKNHKAEDSILSIKLAFAGDIMQHKPQIDAAYIDSIDGYDYTPVFRFVKDIISHADIAIANLETTLGGKPYTGYPQFSAPDTLAWFIKDAGFDMLVTANNHSVDRSGKGILGTITNLDRYGIPHTGIFKDSAERALKYPLIMEKNGIKIAFLNYTYGTNGLIPPSPYIVNMIDTAVIKQDLIKAKSLKPDAIIVVYHWGIEYQRNENKEQTQIAKFSFEQGADLVIGAHPHVIQPTKKMTYTRDSTQKSGWVVYSMGNFVSNQRDRYRDAGEIVFFNLSKNKNSGKISIDSAAFVPTWVYIKPNPKTYFILPSAAFVEDTTFIEIGKDKMLQSLEDTRKLLLHDSLDLHEMDLKKLNILR